MKFIKELIASKSWNADQDAAKFGEDDVRRDLEEGGFDSPLAARSNGHEADVSDFAAEFDAFDEDDDDQSSHATLNAALRGSLTADDSMSDDEDDEGEDAFSGAEDEWDDAGWDEDEPEEWNIGLSDEDLAEANVEQEAISRDLSYNTAEETEIFDTEPEDEFDDAAEMAAIDAAIEAQETADHDTAPDIDKDSLLDEIHTAVDSVRHIRSDEERGRQAKAREQLGGLADAATDERVFEATDDVMNEDKGAKRRHAIALMKAAAAATRTDPKLQNMVGRDPTADPIEQSDYRKDLEDISSTDGPDPLVAKASEPAVADEVAEADVSAPQEYDDAEATMAWQDEEADEDAFENDPSEIESPVDGQDVPAGEVKQTESLRAALFGRMAELDADEPTDEVSQAQASNEEQDETTHEAGANSLWNEEAEDASDEPESDIEIAQRNIAQIVQVPPPAMGRGGRQTGRVKTRLLGFKSADEEVDDPFKKAASSEPTRYPTGWLVVVEGPGTGHSFTLSAGVSQIGRGEGQAVRLDFGDSAISRENHAAVAFDNEHGEFFLGHGGKSNIVRLNGKPVLSTESIKSGDEIRLGETTLRFVALCGEGFNWDEKGSDNAGKAAIA